MECIIVGQKLVALYKKHEDTGNIDYSDDLFNLASVYYETGSYAQAKGIYIESIRLVKKLLGKGRAYADRLNDIALCCTKLDEYDDAVKYLREAGTLLSADEQEYSPEHLDCLYNLANVYYDMGDYDESIKLHSTVLFCRKYEDDAYSDSLNCIGYAYEKQGDLENSINYIKRATANIKKLHSINSEEYLANIFYMAQIYNKKYDYALAIKNYEEARRVINRLYNDKHPYYADTLNRLA
jgi:tetratricopeptide (TPR) repeat protein